MQKPTTIQTTVKEVTWNITKSGMLKPVINIDNEGGPEMVPPCGHNARYVINNRIAKGAVVKMIIASGDIPVIKKITSPADDQTVKALLDNLQRCPHCGGSLSWNSTGTDIQCANTDCSGRRLEKIKFFYKTCNNKGMSDETITRIYNAGYDSLAVMLDMTFDELVEINGIAAPLANKILAQNALIKRGVEISRLMHASGCFPGIGQVKAAKILSEMPPAERHAFTEGLAEALDPEELSGKRYFIKANKTMQSLLLGIKPFYRFIVDNRLTVLPFNEPANKTASKYLGMNVCFTGIRDAILEAEIAAEGGAVCSNVTQKTTHLIAERKDSYTGKVIKAMQMGIPILTVGEFRNIKRNTVI